MPRILIIEDDEKLREEMIQREKERREYMDDWFKTHKFFTKDDLIQLDKTHPQTLSNGYKYYNQALSYYMKNNLNLTTKKSKNIWGRKYLKN